MMEEGEIVSNRALKKIARKENNKNKTPIKSNNNEIKLQKELVAATNDSSIKSKRSMVGQGYFKDDFGRVFVPHPTTRRSPLINR